MKNYYAEDVFFKTYWKTKNVGWVSRMIFFSKNKSDKNENESFMCRSHSYLLIENYLIQVLLEHQNAKLLADGTII